MTDDADIPVLAWDELRARGKTAVQVGATRVLLVDVDGEVRAYDNRCPHRAWPLERGTLCDGVLTCPNHGWSFDVATGRGVDPGDRDLVPYRCRVDDDGIIRVATAP